MTVTLDIKPEAEARLCARATAEGISVETYLQRAVESLLNTRHDEEEPDYLDDSDIPILQPKTVRHMQVTLVRTGRTSPLAVDDEDWVDLDA